MNRLSVTLCSVLCLLFPYASADDNSKAFDHYTVHYSAFNSDFLTPEVAKAYGLTRSKVLGLLNITVIDNQTGNAVTANIEGNAYNLAGQNKDLAFKEIREEKAVYYIANFRFANQERLNFKLDIKPSGQQNTYQLDFSHTMYINKE